MSTGDLIINVLALLIAFVAVTGSTWALLKQQVVVDNEGHASEVEVPLLGRLKTNYPSLIGLLIGVTLAVYVIQRHEPVRGKIELEGNMAMDELPEGWSVFVTAAPKRYLTPLPLGQTVSIDVDDNERYNVIAFALGGIRADGTPVYSVSLTEARRAPEGNKLIFGVSLPGASRPSAAAEQGGD
jgi:hypothetical protein